MNTPAMPPLVARQARLAAQTLLSEVEGARAVVIATVDGFDLAHAGRDTIEPARLAAMVSSLSALGDAASRETGIGTPLCLVVESSEGRLLVRCVRAFGESFIVVLLTDKSVLLGFAWNRLAAAEQLLNAA